MNMFVDIEPGPFRLGLLNDYGKMDDQLLDTICEVFVSSLSTEGACIVREVNAFHQHDRLKSSTASRGGAGFFNSVMHRPSDFCGKELLDWALLPKAMVNLPSKGQRIVRTLAKDGAFGKAERCSTLHFYSHHWRTWAACFVQAAWYRYRRKMAKHLSRRESFNSRMDGSMLKEDEVNIIP